MRAVIGGAVLFMLVGSGAATAQTPEVVYTWAGVPSTTKNWLVQDCTVPGAGTNCATISGATGDLVVTETGTGLPGPFQGVVGGSVFIVEHWNYPREGALAKGNQDVTGLDHFEVDIRHNNPTATVPLDFILLVGETENWVVPSGTAWPIGPGLNTIHFPLSLLTPRQQASIKALYLIPQAHTSVGNLTWTISEVRTVGTPLTYRDIVTNNAGSPDDGIDGAFPLNPDDMLAIVGNLGASNQEGFTRNPAGTGSLQWTDRGGTGAPGSESGATIGWGSGAGWRNTTQEDQIGSPTSGNSYNERIANFSNYDRMTVRISAQDLVNPSGTAAIESPFFETEFTPPVILPGQNLTTDGQYHELVYDLSSVPFLKNIWHWGLDVAPHANNIVFNIDNIRLWNSTTPQGVPGDYNNNGVVDAADYVLWRNGGPLQNENATPGSNTPDDYTFWRAHFGATSGSGAAVTAAVPEPNVVILLLMAAVTSLWIAPRRPRAND